MTGWIKLYRKVLDSAVFQNDGLLKVWVWCLLRASHTTQHVPVTTGRGETIVTIQPGQFLYGRKSAAKILKMPPGSVRGRMAKLERMGNIATQSAGHYSIITVVNWTEYQDYTTQPATQAPPKHQANTNQQPPNSHPNTNHPPHTIRLKSEDNGENANKGEKVKKKGGKPRARFTPPTVEEVQAYCTERGNTIDAAYFVDHYTARGWKLKGGNPVKDWKACVRTWEGMDRQRDAANTDDTFRIPLLSERKTDE